MKYTSEIFQRLSRGQFISSNSIDADTRAIYNDIEENQQEYEDYFGKIDFQLSCGDGFYYFSRKEAKVIIENKLAGTQFSLVQMEVRLATIPGLKEKLTQMFPDKTSNRQKLEALAGALENMGFAELVNEADGTYQVTNAFHYIEQIILCINIDEDVKDEIPQ